MIGAPVLAFALASIVATVPEHPDPLAYYVFYLHGRIVQEQGAHAVSPRYGPYEYGAIVHALAADGNVVISEVRTKGTDPDAYARATATQVRSLLAAGVPAAHVTVIGASMGGYIALHVSSAVEDPHVGYVVLGTCDEQTIPLFRGRLHGEILSIYEASVTEGSCAALIDGTPGVTRHAEIRLETGLAHGFLFRPLPSWVDPALRWARERRIAHPTPARTSARTAPR
jgi:hypothetical protein